MHLVKRITDENVQIVFVYQNTREEALVYYVFNNEFNGKTKIINT